MAQFGRCSKAPGALTAPVFSGLAGVEVVHVLVCDASCVDDLEYATTGDGKQVAFRVYSSGPGEPLLYLPGLLYSIESIPEDPPYARLISGLAEIRPLVLVERQGVAASDPVDFSQDVWEQWAGDVVAVLDHLGIERGSLMSSYIGANIVLETADRFPDRVESVIALHPLWFSTPDDQRDRMLKVVDRDPDAGRDELARSAPSRAGEQGFRDWFTRIGRMAASPTTAGHFWEAVTRPSNLAERLEQAQTPVMLVCRRDYDDYPGGFEGLVELADRMPNGQLVILDGADGLVNAGDIDGLVFEVGEFLLGEHRPSTVSRPVMSLLFTDVVDSTATVRSVGDTDWRSLLDHHDHVIDRTVRRFGGVMVKATGDGALTMFDAPSRAVHCAVALRARLEELGLEVRMGVHLGEIERRGEDVAGVAVHLAARVMAAADGGEILTSAAIPLATMGGGFSFQSCGHRTLKGFDEEFELFCVVVSDP